jgi:hypothetical protein
VNNSTINNQFTASGIYAASRFLSLGRGMAALVGFSSSHVRVASVDWLLSEATTVSSSARTLCRCAGVLLFVSFAAPLVTATGAVWGFCTSRPATAVREVSMYFLAACPVSAGHGGFCHTW